MDFLTVTSGSEDNTFNMPLNGDMSLSLSDVQTYFPNAIGLKYTTSESKLQTLVKVIDGVMFPPPGGWKDTIYTVVTRPESDIIDFSKLTTKDEYPESSVNSEENGVDDSEKKNTNTDDDSEKKNVNTDLVVLGIPFNLSDKDLKEYFEAIGPVQFASIKKHKDTGRSKGFGFIRFESSEAAMKALVKRHKIGNNFMDVQISESAKAKREHEDLKRKVHISGFLEHVRSSKIKEFFETFGKVSEVYCPKPFRNYVFVTFESASVALFLINQKKVKMEDLNLIVTAAYPKNTIKEKRNYSRTQQGPQYRNDHPQWGYKFGHQDDRRRTGPIDPWINSNHVQTSNSNLLEAVVYKAVSEVLNIQNRTRGRY